MEWIESLKKIMNRSSIELNDFPDEVLLLIFKEMSNVEVLYSLFNVNERLDSIIRDSVFTNHLNFLKWSSKRYLNIFSPDIIFDRFCSQILPSVNEKIQWLSVESSTMKEILCATNYPNLNGLALCNLQRETVENLFTGKNIEGSSCSDETEIFFRCQSFISSFSQSNQ